MPGRVVSVNVGLPREIEWLGRRATTSIWKEPVEGRVEVAGVNLAGDDQADRNFHGGPDKAVYAYAREDYAWWAEELARPVEDATFGENLTLEGLDVCAAVIGERWSIGSTLLEVAGPRTPCWKLGARMNDPEFPVWFAAAGRPGAYLRIVEEGALGSRGRRRGRPPARATPSRSATWRRSTTAAGAGPRSSSGLPSSGRSGAPGSRSDSRARALSFPGSAQAVAVSDGCGLQVADQVGDVGDFLLQVTLVLLERLQPLLPVREPVAAEAMAEVLPAVMSSTSVHAFTPFRSRSGRGSPRSPAGPRPGRRPSGRAGGSPRP